MSCVLAPCPSLALTHQLVTDGFFFFFPDHPSDLRQNRNRKAAIQTWGSSSLLPVLQRQLQMLRKQWSKLWPGCHRRPKASSSQAGCVLSGDLINSKWCHKIPHSDLPYSSCHSDTTLPYCHVMWQERKAGPKPRKKHCQNHTATATLASQVLEVDLWPLP
jgi:hypothetical protein